MFEEPLKSLKTFKVADLSPDPYALYLKDIQGPALLNKDEEQSYGRLSQQGDRKAKHRMIEANLRLVVKIAKRYQNSGIPLSDLIAEGNLGLIHAVDKFDPERGFRFSTYSAWWIQQSIERGILMQKPTVRLPVHIAKKLHQCLKAKKNMADADNPEPNAQDIARALGKTQTEVAEMLCLHEKTISIDGPISEEIQKPLLDSLKVDTQEEPSEKVNQLKIENHLKNCLRMLNQRQKAIIEHRFGLNGLDTLTLDETGSAVGLTRERVRQVQNEALALLRRYFQNRGDKLDSLIPF